MNMSFSHTTPNGQSFTLSLECGDLTSQQVSDLDTGEARARIAMVLAREVERCAQIACVAIADASVKRQQEQEVRERKRAGIPEPKKGPAMILGAGTKDPKVGRITLDAKGNPTRG